MEDAMEETLPVASVAPQEPANWVWVVPLCVFATGAMCGLFLTSLIVLHSGNWMYWASVRILWQLGGGIWCGAALCIPAGESRWKGALCGGLLGMLLCVNPLLDMLQGPREVTGTVAGVWDKRGQVWRRGAFSTTIHGRIVIAQDEGGSCELQISGRQANLWLDRLSNCRDGRRPVRVTVLRYLCVILEVEELSPDSGSGVMPAGSPPLNSLQ